MSSKKHLRIINISLVSLIAGLLPAIAIPPSLMQADPAEAHPRIPSG